MVRYLIQSILVVFALVSVSLTHAMAHVKSPRLTGSLPQTLPDQLDSSVVGSWAHDTMTRRVIEDILYRIIQDNEDELVRPSTPDLAECFLQLNDLKSSLLSQRTGFLRSLADGGPDVEVWDKILSSVPYEKRNWVEAPWVISEFYLYRRVIECFRFFKTGYDMFLKQKVSGLQEALPQIELLATRIENLLNMKSLESAIEIVVQTSLWGNKMDLSLWPANNEGSASRIELSTEGSSTSLDRVIQKGKSFILDDSIQDVVKLLMKDGSAKDRVISVIVDNAGYELVTDLILGHVLLSLGIASKVVYHTKAHPTFVSDATTNDCVQTIRYLESESGASTSHLGKALMGHLSAGNFEFQEDLFWCQPTAFWDMPIEIEEKLCSSGLVFVKGDANYRRLLGERDWPLHTDAAMVLSYWPVPVCALRTFKAEIGCGVSQADQSRAAQVDANWMVAGKWGVVQLGGRGARP